MSPSAYLVLFSLVALFIMVAYFVASGIAKQNKKREAERKQKWLDSVDSLCTDYLNNTIVFLKKSIALYSLPVDVKNLEYTIVKLQQNAKLITDSTTLHQVYDICQDIAKEVEREKDRITKAVKQMINNINFIKNRSEVEKALLQKHTDISQLSDTSQRGLTKKIDQVTNRANDFIKHYDNLNFQTLNFLLLYNQFIAITSVQDVLNEEIYGVYQSEFPDMDVNVLDDGQVQLSDIPDAGMANVQDDDEDDFQVVQDDSDDYSSNDDN